MCTNSWTNVAVASDTDTSSNVAKYIHALNVRSAKLSYWLVSSHLFFNSFNTSVKDSLVQSLLKNQATLSLFHTVNVKSFSQITLLKSIHNICDAFANIKLNFSATLSVIFHSSFLMLTSLSQTRCFQYIVFSLEKADLALSKSHIHVSNL